MPPSYTLYCKRLKYKDFCNAVFEMNSKSKCEGEAAAKYILQMRVDVEVEQMAPEKGKNAFVQQYILNYVY